MHRNPKITSQCRCLLHNCSTHIYTSSIQRSTYEASAVRSALPLEELVRQFLLCCGDLE